MANPTSSCAAESLAVKKVQGTSSGMDINAVSAREVGAAF